MQKTSRAKKKKKVFSPNQCGDLHMDCTILAKVRRQRRERRTTSCLHLSGRDLLKNAEAHVLAMTTKLALVQGGNENGEFLERPRAL